MKHTTRTQCQHRSRDKTAVAEPSSENVESPHRSFSVLQQLLDSSSYLPPLSTSSVSSLSPFLFFLSAVNTKDYR